MSHRLYFLLLATIFCETFSKSQNISNGLLYYYPVYFETESPDKIASAIIVDEELTKEFENVLRAIKPKLFYPQKYHRFYVGYSEVLYHGERKVYGQIIDISERKVYETKDFELLKSFKLLVERYAEYYEKYNIYGGGLSHTSINNLKYENKANTHSYALRRTIMCRRRLGSL